MPRLVAGLVAADAVLPLVPGETVVIAAAVLAADGELSLALVFAAAAAGSAAPRAAPPSGPPH